jgi:glycosyltransferase involved in cell wall biosynthesis
MNNMPGIQAPIPSNNANTMPTILHTEWAPGWGGQEIRVFSESLAFQKRGYRVLIACHPNGRLYAKAQESGLQVIPLRLRKGLSFDTIFETMRIIRREKVDLVHTHSSVDAWRCGLAAKLLGVPVVRSRHLTTPIRTGPLNRFLYMKLADRVITSGKAIKETMVAHNGMDADRIVSVPAGVDETIFTPDVDGIPIRREFNILDNEFLVVIVAVLRGWKGHTHLINAVEKLRQSLPVKLLIVGSGPQEQNLHKLIEERSLQEYVFMAGHRQDVPACMAAADCVVLPSTGHEATSQVIPQAQAMQKPVVVTNVGGLSEVVLDKQTGLVVPPHDADALANALRWIFENPAEAAMMAERGRLRCLQNFTFEKMIRDTEAVYMELLGCTRRLA